jgi:ferritin-like protein
MRVLQKPTAVAPKSGDLTQRAGVERIVDQGVDVAVLIDRLVRAAASELMTYFSYLGLRMQLAGNESQKAACEQARLNNRGHFDLIVPRIYELGGTIPSSLEQVAQDVGADSPGTASEQGAAETPAGAALLSLLEHERSGLRTWADIADLTFGTDGRTHRLASVILDDKIQHEAWFIELLSKERDGVSRPSGHLFATVASMADAGSNGHS